MFRTSHNDGVRQPFAAAGRRFRGALALAAGLLAGAALADPPKPGGSGGDSPPTLRDATKKQPPRLEEALAARAPEILAFLQKNKYRSVGVLNFQVRRGEGKASAVAGLLNRRMADRLEVALALAMKDESVRLLRGASATVDQAEVKPRPDHLDPKGRKSFFKIKNYKPAWGTEAERENGMPAEAFLTGLAHLDRKAGVMNVRVRAFDCKGKERDVCTFVAAAAADPAVMTEAGVSFARARGDDSLLEKIYARRESPLTALEKAPVEFTLLYGGEPVTVREQKDADDEEAVVRAPRAGQKVTLRLKHRGEDKETYGVVVKVNGENTVDPERTHPTPIHNRKWVLTPGARTTIIGFQSDDKVARAFRVVPLSEAESSEQRYPDKFGTIEVVVFRAKKKGDPESAEPDEVTAAISRGLPGVGGAPTELKALQDELTSKRGKGTARGLGLVRDGAIQPGEEERSPVKAVAFDPAPDPVASITIRYVLSTK
jgi:hypothetical protein